jgi:hypothetical protein
MPLWRWADLSNDQKDQQMNANMNILQALTGGASAPGWANPEIQKGSMGQPEGPLGQLEDRGNNFWQKVQNSRAGPELSRLFGGQIGQPIPQVPQTGMLGGQPPQSPFSQAPSYRTPTASMPIYTYTPPAGSMTTYGAQASVNAPQPR